MLMDIDEASKKAGVLYFLCAGTALGAIRHKGFIPWDDDIDLMVYRDNIDAFISAMEENLPEGKYYIQRPFTEDWCHPYYKIRMNGTTAIEEEYLESRTHQGLFIDVFVANRYPESAIRCHLTNGSMRLVGVLENMCNRTIGKKGLIDTQKLWLISLKTVHRMMDLFPEKGSTRWHNRTCSYRIINDTELLESSMDVQFEGGVFPTYSDVDTYLSKLYGDYMELPPEDKRVGEHLMAFDATMDYKDWLKIHRSKNN